MDAIGSEKKSPYHGLWVIFVISGLMPLVLFYIFRLALDTFDKSNSLLNSYGAVGFAGLATTLFHISCIIAGLWTEPFSIVCNRLKDFFRYLRVIKKKAFSVYFDDLKEEGIVFWILFLIFMITLGITIYCSIYYFKNI